MNTPLNGISEQQKWYNNVTDKYIQKRVPFPPLRSQNKGIGFVINFCPYTGVYVKGQPVIWSEQHPIYLHTLDHL